MEMGTLATDQTAQAQPQQKDDDIMQVARLGDIQVMEKLFESHGYDATYTDDEGITPLHVWPPTLGPRARVTSDEELTEATVGGH